ncbi:MAG: bidirectional [NiFe] hydrogenase diaphorase subunit [Eubacteriales bacterium]|nr:bidirectional [NiFe] hydrogenase diaphorase subunit [Eubacteriales bacterium]MDN5363161.1 bidirectional [NiFe] hydrogenase diaphorase subunit [Eubacteriales bacterium]
MSRQVTITIDGQQVTAAEGDKLLWVALDHGIYIPHLCGIREKEHPDASCRLCFVEVEGLPNPVTSCTLPVKEGMVVRTRSERVDRLVRTAFELLLSNHRLSCAKCGKNGRCELQKIAQERGLKLKLTRMRSLLVEKPVDDSPEKFYYDPNRCVLCGRCVWADREKAKIGAIGFVRRGMDRRVAAFWEQPLADSPCIECLACVEACPVGALVAKEMKE